MIRKLISYAFLASVVFGASGDAATLRVPADYATIQAAVNASANGDTIQIAAGTYAEDVEVELCYWLTIKGQGKVVIDPPSGNGFTTKWCTGVTVQKVRIDGGYFNVEQSHHVTIRKCRAAGGLYGFRVKDSTAVTLEQNRVEDPISTAIIASGSHDCTLRKNRVREPGSGGGFSIAGTRNSIVGNRLRGGWIGIHVTGSSNLIADNRVKGVEQSAYMLGAPYSAFLDNVARDAEDGVRVLAADYSVISGNKVTRVSRYGLDFISYCFGNTVRRNQVRRAASAGIHASTTETRFFKNKVKKGGSFGIYVIGDLNVYEQNYARSQPGGVDLYESLNATQNTYIDNDVVTTNTN